MTPDQRDRVWLRFLAVWPTPRMSEPTELVWLEQFTPLEADRALRTVNVLTRQETHRPSIAKFVECYDAQHGTTTQVLARPECGMCDDGWIIGSCGRPGCAKENCGVLACPNGCKPMTHAEREAQWAFSSQKPDPAAKARIHDIILQAGMNPNAKPPKRRPPKVKR